MSDAQLVTQQQELLDKAVAEGGAYEVLNKRLQEQGNQLRHSVELINQHRLAEFKHNDLEVIGRIRIRTENNSVARDIVRVGEWLLFGYNVFLGLKKETKVEDVFSLYKLVVIEDGFDVEPVALADTFLADSNFIRDFTELYAYYKDARLLQLTTKNGKLLASFQIGEKITDIRVFRWSLSADHKQINYIDNRGERDIALPAPYDFEWQKTSRDMRVNGKYPHINILDTVFVETIGGDLTVKIENNTTTGLGIYSEPVNDKTQSVDDASIEFAQLGSLILLKILPYREEAWRYLVYNTITQHVERIDAIGQSCVQLPEDHGIIFPGGYCLQNGEHKKFDLNMQGMRFKRSVKSPNGEDVLYIFYEPSEGRSVLFTYNMIERRLQNPIQGHGYARFDDGRMVIFANEGNEPIRVHPMQVWQTPYMSDEYIARQPSSNTFWGRIGNAELVRGISDLYSIGRDIDAKSVSVNHYNLLRENIRKLLDSYSWLTDPHCGEIVHLIREIAATSEAVLDEYEKVESIRHKSAETLKKATDEQQKLLASLRPDSWETIEEYVTALHAISSHLGQLLTIRDYRYMDLLQVAKLEEQLKKAQLQLSEATGVFLSSPEALAPFSTKLSNLDTAVQAAKTVLQLEEPTLELKKLGEDLDTISQLMSSLKIDDANQRTSIVEAISAIYGRLNQVRAKAEQSRKGLRSSESIAQFGAQFTLFTQSITNALSLATDPERCDDQLSRLLVQLEELESQFSDSEEFLADILAKREELLETFESHKQSLLDDRQRKAQSLQDAALRILESIKRRTERFSSQEELNVFFAGDPLSLKLHELSDKLRELKDSVRADDIDARLKATKDQAIRILRDKSDIYEAGGNVIKLGPRHRFSVNTQELDLTIMPRDNQLYAHLTGTDYFEPLGQTELDELQEYWQYTTDAESSLLYRGEYLAGLILQAAEQNDKGLTIELLESQLKEPELLAKTIRDFAAPRYKEGYERGIHDHDAGLLLAKLIPLHRTVGLLRFPPLARGFASLFWGRWKENIEAETWPERAHAGMNMLRLLGSRQALKILQEEIVQAMDSYLELNPLPVDAQSRAMAADYLVAVLADGVRVEFTFSRYAKLLLETLQKRLEASQMWLNYQQSLANLQGRTLARWELATSWFTALCNTDYDEKTSSENLADLQAYIPEAVALSLLDSSVTWHFTEMDLRFIVDGLMGEHSRIQNTKMVLGIDDFYQRFAYQCQVFVPAYQKYQMLCQDVIKRKRNELRLEEFKPKPLSSFVRNKLINDVYLGIIGDNLAKQIGTVGENKRTDLMGLLMLISPPGYGKTTLMEYVANRLGLIFMKINGPAVGHGVTSVDPAQAPNATARQELEKLNLALEMGNNVMLYVDDIQHTNPEFLQKFISLCDGTRRIEGVWHGQTKTYDMRGKKFCVVMAGNPYTESGEVFKIPDMLANRADIYNLGDVLGGMEDVFKLSYLENCLTSNPILAPLATRDMADLYRFIDKAEDKPFSSNELSYDYSGAEINEIVATLQHLIRVRDLVYKINLQYIASAAQADKYRVEPPFKLQGSYRNMNKLAEKITAVMNQQELAQLLEDHYQGEAQLLTTGAEENLLKLAEIRGNMTDQQQQRWQQIKDDFLRNKAMGGDDNVGNRVVAQLVDLADGVRNIAARPEPEKAPWNHLLERFAEMITIIKQQSESTPWDKAIGVLAHMAKALDRKPEVAPWDEVIKPLTHISEALQDKPETNVQVVNQPVPGLDAVLTTLAETLEYSFMPLLKTMDKKLEIDLRNHQRMQDIIKELRLLGVHIGMHPKQSIETRVKSGETTKTIYHEDQKN